jgi:magnesium transporter
MIQHIRLPNTARFTWVYATDPTPAELDQLAATYNLHPTSLQDCLEPHHIPKYEPINDHVFILLRSLDEFASQEADTIRQMTRKMALFIGDDFLVTISRADISTVLSVKDLCELPEAPHLTPKVPTLVELVLMLLEKTGQSYKPILNLADMELDQLEAVIFDPAQPPFDLQKTYTLKRRMLVVKKMLRSTLEVVRKFDYKTAEQRPYFRSVREDIEGLLLEAEERVHDCDALLNLYLSIASHRTNEVVRTLTLFSIFFLPITFIASVYGMNFKFMPELETEYGYFCVLGLMAVVELVIWWYFKRKDWL